jgi:hypothetical protein
MRSSRSNKKSRKFRAIKLNNQNAKISSSVQSLIREIPDRLFDGSFATSYLRDEFLSKLNDSEPGSAERRRSAAIQKWKAVEERNKAFTLTFSEIDPGWNILPFVTMKSFIKQARRLVRDVLGELTDTVVLGNFSGGASTSRKRSASEKSGKFVGMADVTESAMPYVDLIHREAPLLRQYGSFYSLRESIGAILFTVPKNADIDRCACKEPDINMFLQKGVGRYLYRRLLRFGINTHDQSINRALAREGSITGELATIDLSSASDSVNTCIVEALLPRDWFLYLNDIRSQNVVVDGEIVRTAMFSSMGNGFTFELESLIFWVLMKTTSYFRGNRGAVSVYGDDIIVPSKDYDTYLWVLSKFGFYPNEKKSFGTGNFRESCGGHYFSGIDVTPFYLRLPPLLLTDLIRVCNQLRKWAFADDCRRYGHRGIFPLWKELASHVPQMFWGGHDVDLDTRLVSPPLGDWKLLRISRPKKLGELGRYLSWHCDNWNRALESEVTDSFPPTETEKFCRRRRDNSAYIDVELFYEEQFPDYIPV